jgi:hypothetical protein
MALPEKQKNDSFIIHHIPAGYPEYRGQVCPHDGQVSISTSSAAKKEGTAPEVDACYSQR